MESEKHYTPDIEELLQHIVIEKYCYTKVGDHLATVQFNNIVDDLHSFIENNNYINDTYSINPNLYFLKYLDQEDIESIIHENASDFHTMFKLRNTYTDELVFQTYWIEEKEYLDEEYIYWNVKYNTIKITHKSKTLFYGIIKNKSVLTQVLKMVGVIEDEKEKTI